MPRSVNIEPFGDNVSKFLQVGCPSLLLANSVKSLKRT